MIVLDTNVISEAMKPEPHASVRAWLNRQAGQTLFVSSVTLAELMFGLASLPHGKKKNFLEKACNEVLKLFNDRILPFDTDAARQYALLATKAKGKGRGFPQPDSYIAAIAASRGFLVATRDVSPYEAVDLKVINPWDWHG